MVPLSPLHGIEIDETYQYLLKRPTENDFPLHTIARKIGPDGRELMHMELVIAGKKTRDRFPLTHQYPIHFLKSYHPWSFHGDPALEYYYTEQASRLLASPPPLGYDASSFRACFIPGKTLSKISPFTDLEPVDQCLTMARDVPVASLIGLWHLLEKIYAQVGLLHKNSFYHGDLELHNVVVSTSPIEPFLIDFESSSLYEGGDDEVRQVRRQKDLKQIALLAIIVQAGLGEQEGPLANVSQELLPLLIRSPEMARGRMREARRRGTQAGGGI